jgi:hypothetical protein
MMGHEPSRDAVLATWIIRSETSPPRPGKISFSCLQTQEGRCRISCRQQHIHARMTIFSRDGEVIVMAGVLASLWRHWDGFWHALSSRLTHWTKPLVTSLPLATLTDLSRSKCELVAEKALLRHQLAILQRQVKRSSLTRTDRVLLVLIARLVSTWKQAHITRSTRHTVALAS